MGFLDAVDIYFRGERHTGLALVPVGLAVMGFGVYLFHWYGGGLGKGMGIPLAIAGLAAAIGGGVLARTVDNRQAELSAAYETEPDAPRVAEVARMDKVNANWKALEIAWTALLVLSLGVLWGVDRDWAKGLALALICLCAILLVVDTFAERRALVYADRIAAPPGT